MQFKNPETYLFETIDLMSLLGMCNKERIVRQLSVLLMIEAGKLKRLLFPKEGYKVSLYDILDS